MRPASAAEREPRRRGRRRNAGHRSDFGGESLLERDPLLEGEGPSLQIQERDRHRPVLFEAGLDGRQVSEGLHESSAETTSTNDTAICPTTSAR